MDVNFTIGKGSPPAAPAYTRLADSKYRAIYSGLEVGSFVQFDDRKQALKFYCALKSYIKTHSTLPWRAKLNSAECRVYVLAADGDKPTDRKA